jgi:hypothetical protein
MTSYRSTEDANMQCTQRTKSPNLEEIEHEDEHKQVVDAQTLLCKHGRNIEVFRTRGVAWTPA